MTTTSLSKLIGIAHPVFQAPMAGVSTPALAAAVTNAGGLGALGIGAATPDAARQMIAGFRALSDGPLHANLFCHAEPVRDEALEADWIRNAEPKFEAMGAEPPASLNNIYHSFIGNEAMTGMLMEMQPEVISFHFGLPDANQIAALKATGAVLMASATNVEEAKAIEAAGLDAVIAQGWEAGGHRGMFDPDAADDRLAMAELVQAITQAIALPVVAAGGIMDGVDIRAVLDAGAQAAQLGTAFVGCPESSADNAYRERLAMGGETVMTRAISGRPARCLTNGFTQWTSDVPPSQVPAYPVPYDLGKALNAAAKSAGDGGYGAQWSGTGASRARILPVGELMALLISEMNA